MNSKYFFLLAIILIGSLNFISSVPPITSVSLSNNGGLVLSPNIWDNVVLNNNLTFHVHVFNSSNGLAYSGANVKCFLHIYDEDYSGEHIYTNDTGAIIEGYDYEFSVIPITRKGEYSYKVWCNESTSLVGGFYEKSFYVTASGQAPAGDTFTLFIYVLFIISSIGLFTTFILTIVKLVTFKETIFGVLTTWGFVILNIIVNYLGKEYLLRTFIEDMSGFFITVTIWSNGVLPLIGLIVTMFIVGTKKKRPLNVEEITGGRRLMQYG